jgi:hypothetical protein
MALSKIQNRQQSFWDPHHAIKPADAAHRMLAAVVVASGGVESSEAPKLKSPGWDEVTTKTW